MSVLDRPGDFSEAGVLQTGVGGRDGVSLQSCRILPSIPGLVRFPTLALMFVNINIFQKFPHYAWDTRLFCPLLTELLFRLTGNFDLSKFLMDKGSRSPLAAGLRAGQGRPLGKTAKK